jgi:hypothetical protein
MEPLDKEDVATKAKKTITIDVNEDGTFTLTDGTPTNVQDINELLSLVKKTLAPAEKVEEAPEGEEQGGEEEAPANPVDTYFTPR